VTTPDIELTQDKILGILLQNPNLVSVVRDKIKPEYFSHPNLRKIYLEILAHFEENYQSGPNAEILETRLCKKFPKEVEIYCGLVTRVSNYELSSEDPKQISYYCGELKESFDRTALVKSLMASADLVKSGNIRGASEILQKTTIIQSNDFFAGDIKEDFEKELWEMEYRRKHPELFSGVKTGFNNLDQYTGGHFRKELSVVVAGAGTGKSLFLGAVAVNIAKSGKKCLLVTVENPKRPYMDRLYSNLCEIPYRAFKNNDLSPDQVDKWKAEMSKLSDDFYLKIVEFPAGCSTLDIQLYVSRLPSEIDYLIVDQITNMNANDSKEFRQFEWRTVSKIALELKQLSGTIYSGKGLPILSAIHASSGTGDKRELGVDDIALAKSVAYHAHSALWITKVDDQYQIGASKYRDARIEPFPVYPDFTHWRLSEVPTDGTQTVPTT
jgi:replicative DNA helicase